MPTVVGEDGPAFAQRQVLAVERQRAVDLHGPNPLGLPVGHRGLGRGPAAADERPVQLRQALVFDLEELRVPLEDVA